MNKNKKPMKQLSNRNRAYLFVDGSNMYAGQYQLFGPANYLSFPKFILQIEKMLKITFKKIFFYASYSPRPKNLTKKARKYLRNESLFYRSVQQTPKTIFNKGYRSKTSGKEKEVDVKLSVDLVGMGLLGKYDQAYLISGDADFLQAVFFIKKHCSKKKIKLICLSNKIMYKGLYYLPSWVIEFKKGAAKRQKIAKKAKVVYIKKTAELCPRLS